MTVQNIGIGISAGTVAPSSGKFFLPGASAFADTLSIGQIIQGRVLRGFDENHYLVAFSGGERVVDSAVPLTAGEVLHGRVVGLGERVELQRVYPNQQDSAGRVPTPEPRSTPQPSGSGATIDNILLRYSVELSEADRAELQRVARSAGEPEALGLAAAMLSKLGLPQSGVLLDVLVRAQRLPAVVGVDLAKLDPESLPQIVTAPQQSAELQASSLRQLADLVEHLTQHKSSTGTGPASAADSRQASLGWTIAGDAAAPRDGESFPDQGSQRNAQNALADRLLNAQTGGIVAHRYGLLPLLVGGRLVEVSFALFEQRKPASQPQGLQHRQVQFSVHTQRLGRVNVLARITGGHVRIHITTDRDENAVETALHTDSLHNALLESGWHVDQIAYGTQTDAAHNAVARSVIEHVVSLDSLNRLV